MKYEGETHKIIGCAMKVYNTLGNGFQEVIYQRALAIEMKIQGLSFQREEEMTIYYEGSNIGTRRADFLVEEIILVELKAITKLEDVHLAQIKNYLEAYNLEVGLLINFGAKSLQVKRMHNLREEKSLNPKIMQIKVQTFSASKRVVTYARFHVLCGVYVF
jgi:GxxExxY protein